MRRETRRRVAVGWRAAEKRGWRRGSGWDGDEGRVEEGRKGVREGGGGREKRVYGGRWTKARDEGGRKGGGNEEGFGRRETREKE